MRINEKITSGQGQLVLIVGGDEPEPGGDRGRSGRDRRDAHPRGADFFAQGHTSAEMVYAGADITKAEQAREIIAFAAYWQAPTGHDPGLLVFDSQLSTYAVLG